MQVCVPCRAWAPEAGGGESTQLYANAPFHPLVLWSLLACMYFCPYMRTGVRYVEDAKSNKSDTARRAEGSLEGREGEMWKTEKGEEDPVKILQRSKRGGGNIHSYLSPFLPPSFTSHFLRFLSLSPSPGSQYANVLPLSLRHRGPPPIPHFPLPRQSIYSDEPIINPSPLLQWWLLDK